MMLATKSRLSYTLLVFAMWEFVAFGTLAVQLCCAAVSG